MAQPHTLDSEANQMVLPSLAESESQSTLMDPTPSIARPGALNDRPESSENSLEKDSPGTPQSSSSNIDHDGFWGAIGSSPPQLKSSLLKL